MKKAVARGLQSPLMFVKKSPCDATGHVRLIFSDCRKGLKASLDKSHFRHTS